MKKLLIPTILIVIFSFSVPNFSLAQGIMEQNKKVSQSGDGHTAREEAEGKIIWEKLQTKELKCEDLTDENFGSLGEYFMGQMAGGSHEAMNNMMIRMMGEQGEEQMHIAMGKRMSNCEPNAAVPQNMMNSGMMQMMLSSGMMGNWSNPSAINNFNNPMSMMNFGFASFGWIFMLLFWGLIIFGIVALVKWLTNQNKNASKSDKSALDILKDRYAKGEINKTEFEEKKKDMEF